MTLVTTQSIRQHFESFLKTASRSKFSLLNSEGNRQGHAIIEVTNETYTDISAGSVSTLRFIFRFEVEKQTIGAQTMYLLDNNDEIIGVVSDEFEFQRISRNDDDDELVAKKAWVIARFESEEVEGESRAITFVAHYFPSTNEHQEHVVIRSGEFTNDNAQMNQQDLWFEITETGELVLRNLFYYDGAFDMKFMCVYPSLQSSQTLN
jgi:hypothetical protein